MKLLKRYDLWVVLLLFTLAIPAQRGEWFALVEEQTLSVRQLLRMSYAPEAQRQFPTDKIVLVNTDERFFAEYGSYPLRRTDVATMAQRLKEMGAKVVAVDMLMDFPSSYGEDAPTARAFAAAGDVLMVSQADIREGKFRRMNYPTAPIKATSRSGYTNISSASSVVTSLSRLTVFPEITREPDGWPFAVQAVAMYLGAAPALEGHTLRFGERLQVPLDRHNYLYIDYPQLTHGAQFLSQMPFASISAIELLALEEDELEEMAGMFQGKIVLIGDTSEVSHDWFDTPVGMVYGVEIIADTIHTLLKGGGLTPVSGVTDVFVMLGVMLALIATAFLKNPVARNSLTLAVLATWFAGASWVFVQYGAIVSMSYTLVAGVLSVLAINLYHYLQERSQKGVIKEAFGHYLSPKVVDALVKDPSKLSLGGESREMTAFFSDVAKFSTISEKLTPAELVALLNEYLTGMCDTIAETEGTVDKFEGDAIIAFWGAPLLMQDHAKRACFSAIEQQRRIAAFREHQLQLGKLPVPFHVRIGINTGMMIVGNMGSAQRMDYTMMGDAVNLAARLEGANKFYGSATMISEFTWQAAQDAIDVRELDTIRVVGKNAPVRVFELLDRKNALTGPLAEVVEHFERGRQRYIARDFQDAILNFEKGLILLPDDGPSRTYVERCRHLVNNPPAADWDGVWTLTEKG